MPAKLCAKWIPSDLERGDTKEAIRKHQILAQSRINKFNRHEAFRSTENLREATDAIAAAEVLVSSLPEHDAVFWRGTLDSTQANLYIAQGNPNGFADAQRDALNRYIQAGFQNEAANAHFLLGVAKLNRSRETFHPYFEEAFTPLIGALKYYQTAGVLDQAALTHLTLAKLLAQAFRPGATSMPKPF